MSQSLREALLKSQKTNTNTNTSCKCGGDVWGQGIWNDRKGVIEYHLKCDKCLKDVQVELSRFDTDSEMMSKMRDAFQVFIPVANKDNSKVNSRFEIIDI